MSNWFRAYSEVLNDPKVQTLPLDAFKAWHNALYLAASLSSNDGTIGTLHSVSFAFRETEEAVSSAFQPLIERGLIETFHETFRIVSWRKRQFKSDTSTARVKRHREKMKRAGNVTETAPEAEADTEAEQKRAREMSADESAIVDLSHELSAAAGCCLPDHGRIIENQTIVRGWVRSGAEPKRLRELIAERMASGRAQPKTLRYFDGAVRDDLARKAKQEDGCMAMVREILAAEKVG